MNATGGGACYFSYSAQSYFFLTKFYLNYASIQGGVIGTTPDCFSYFENVLFVENSADKGGVFMLSEESTVIVNSSTFIDNFANEGGVFHSLENYHSWITIINSSFQNNYGEQNLFNALNSNLQIINSQFINNENLVFFLTSSTLLLDAVNITNHSCYSEIVGCIVNSLQTSLLVDNLFLDTITNNEEEGGIYLETSAGVFSNIQFQFLKSSNSVGNCFDLLNSSLNIVNGNFFTYDQNCIAGTNSTLIINNTIFNNDNGADQVSGFSLDISYGTIFCQSCVQFILTSSFLILNRLGDLGGGVGLISNVMDFNISAQFYNVSFIGNEVFEQGGSVYLSNVQSSFNYCNFVQNKADQGAAIYFFSLGINKINFVKVMIFFFLASSQKKLLLMGNTFDNNMAYSEGGAIKWNEVEPIIDSDNIFTNNSASYGPINAGFPFRIEMEFTSLSQTICLNESNSCYPQIMDISSGSSLNFTLSFLIKDIYNTTVTSLDSG